MEISRSSLSFKSTVEYELVAKEIGYQLFYEAVFTIAFLSDTFDFRTIIYPTAVRASGLSLGG